MGGICDRKIREKIKDNSNVNTFLDCQALSQLKKKTDVFFISSPSNIAPPVAELLCAQSCRRDVPCSILGRACRPSLSEISAVFSETGVNTGWEQGLICMGAHGSSSMLLSGAP